MLFPFAFYQQKFRFACNILSYEDTKNEENQLNREIKSLDRDQYLSLNVDRSLSANQPLQCNFAQSEWTYTSERRQRQQTKSTYYYIVVLLTTKEDDPKAY